jgi:uncharacterized Zn-binding protein involved in type VI secretion
MPPKTFECSNGHKTTKLMGNPAFKVTDQISCPQCGLLARNGTQAPAKSSAEKQS